MSRRPHRCAAAAGLALVSGLVALVAVDRLAGRWADPRFVPLVGPPSAERQLALEEFRIHVRTNAGGFRGPALPGAPAPGTVRVVAVGDSFTWGYGVEEDEAYPARLAGALAARTGARVEVVNLGLPGTGPRDYLHHVRRTGLALEPDLVLVGVFANDANDCYQLARFGTRGAYDALGEVLAAPGPRALWKRAAETAVPSLWALAARARRSFDAGPRSANAAGAGPAAAPAADVDPEAVVAALGARYGRRDAVLARWRRLPPAARASLVPVLRGDPPGADGRPRLLLGALLDPEAEADGLLLRSEERRAAWPGCAAHLAAIVRAARAAGALPVLAYLPAAEQVSRGRWGVLEAAGYRLDPALLADTTLADRVGAVAAAEGAAFVDLQPAFRAAADDGLYYVVDEHWTARGHRLAAERLADAIAPLLARAGGA